MARPLWNKQARRPAPTSPKNILKGVPARSLNASVPGAPASAPGSSLDGAPFLAGSKSFIGLRAEAMVFSGTLLSPSIRQRSVLSLDHEWQEQQSYQWDEAQVEHRVQAHIQEVLALKGCICDQYRTGCRNQAAHIVAEPCARGAQTGGEQLGQVECKAAENPEYGEADREIH